MNTTKYISNELSSKNMKEVDNFNLNKVLKR